ncbi:dihydrolipoyllysine-residue succinyltransferase E2 component, partial [Blyttiomyces helicus]
ADKIIKTPPMAESLMEGTLTAIHKNVGEFVARDELIATIETDKVNITVNALESGTVLEWYANVDDTVAVGGNLYRLELGDAPAGGAAPAAPAPAAATPAPAAAAPAPVPEKKVEAPKPGEAPKAAGACEGTFYGSPSTPSPATPVQFSDDVAPAAGSRTERRVKMTRMRLKIAERLKASQEEAASLTTFNEIDMSNLIELRKKYKDLVQDQHGVKLGFMGAFIKASAAALQAVPAVNARIDGTDIVYNDYVDISVAVATPKGLVTPAIRNCEKMSIVDAEKTLAALGKKAKDNQITIEDMAGGTFTISNGGVFGSLYGTPIINLPQSAILGMHATKERAVVVNGQVVVRPMMYVALTYDHRIIDGREAVTFLVKIKEAIEDPRRLLLEV